VCAGFKPNRNNHQRTLLLAAWLKINNKVSTLDLRSMGLEEKEVEFLCHILSKTQLIITADMRENGEMGEAAAQMLVDQVLKCDTNSIGSLCGVTKTKIALSIPRKDIAPTDLIFIAEELEANSWAESNSGKGKPQAEIRRRSSRSYGDWSPLLFAAREGIPDLCAVLIKRKADINQKDQDKLNPGYTALITAATRGDMELVQLLVNAEADVTVGDRNGKSALMLAEQRGFSSIAEFLSSRMGPDPAELEKMENDKKKDDDGKDGKDKDGSKQQQLSLYKGLQEKAANKEKERLSAAAHLADTRYDRWLKLHEELKVLQAMEAAAKSACDEAMAAKDSIASGKQRRGSNMGLAVSAVQLMAAQANAVNGSTTPHLGKQRSESHVEPAGAAAGAGVGADAGAMHNYHKKNSCWQINREELMAYASAAAAPQMKEAASMSLPPGAKSCRVSIQEPIEKVDSKGSVTERHPATQSEGANGAG